MARFEDVRSPPVDESFSPLRMLTRDGALQRHGQRQAAHPRGVAPKCPPSTGHPVPSHGSRRYRGGRF